MRRCVKSWIENNASIVCLFVIAVLVVLLFNCKGQVTQVPKYSALFLGARRLWLALSGQQLKPQRAQLCFAF